LIERRKRKLHDAYALAFLHGLKSRATITGADWPHLLEQINYMLAQLQPPKRQFKFWKR
jgi:hypothetical protein